MANKYEFRQRADGSVSIKAIGVNRLVAETRGQTPEMNLMLAEKIVSLLNGESGNGN